MVDITSQALFNKALSVTGPGVGTKVSQNTKVSTNDNQSFNDILKKELLQSQSTSQVEFSKHAMARAQERGIELTDNLLTKLTDSVQKAGEKGAQNILALDAGRAFIINVPNNKVITTMSGTEMKENIFTNIDSAVIL